MTNVAQETNLLLFSGNLKYPPPPHTHSAFSTLLFVSCFYFQYFFKQIQLLLCVTFCKMNTYNDTHNCNNTTFPLHFWSFFPWYALFVTCLIKHLSPYQLMNFTFVPFNDDHDLTNRPKVLLVAIEIALVIRLSLFIGKTFYFLFHFFLSVFFSLFLFLYSFIHIFTRFQLNIYPRQIKFTAIFVQISSW